MTEQHDTAPSDLTVTEAQVAKRYFGSFAADYHEAFQGGGESSLHRVINRLFRRRTFERRTADVLAVLSRYGVSGKRVLDVGCGSGEVSLVAARLGASVTGVDIVPEMIKIAADEARRQGLGDQTSFSVLDIVSDPLPKVDISLLVGVIEYYRDVDQLLGKVAAVTDELAIVVDTRGPFWRRALRYGLARLKRFNLYYHPPAVVRASFQRRGFEEYAGVAGHSYTLFAFRRTRP